MSNVAPNQSPSGSPVLAGQAGQSVPPPLDPLQELAQLRAQVQHMWQQQQAAQASPPSARAPSLPRPRQPSSFRGEMGFAVDGWLSEQQQQFVYYGAALAQDIDRIRFASSYLEGNALRWWQDENQQRPINDWATFVARLLARFRPVQATLISRQRLDKLKHLEKQHVNQYANAFQTILTPITDMSDADQVHKFVTGLQPDIRRRVFERLPATLKDAIDAAVSIEAVGNYGRSAVNIPSSSYRSAGYGQASSSSAPMEVNHVDASEPAEEEKYSAPTHAADPAQARIEALEHRLHALLSKGGAGPNRKKSDRVPGLQRGDIEKLMAEGRCFRCKQHGHMKSECTMKPSNF